MSNKKVIILTIFIILGMLIFPTIYKIYMENINNKIKVVKEEFLYQAKNCYNKGDCEEDIIYLKDLYDKNYLKDKLSEPISKKYYDDKSYINMKTKEIKLIN